MIKLSVLARPNTNGLGAMAKSSHDNAQIHAEYGVNGTVQIFASSQTTPTSQGAYLHPGVADVACATILNETALALWPAASIVIMLNAQSQERRSS